MSILRCYHREGNIYFIANVTYERKPVLVDNIDLLWTGFKTVRIKVGFDMMAWVILPDHFYIVIDAKRHKISNILQRIKMI
jgi:REP element-mobilizing transposase RayT